MSLGNCTDNRFKFPLEYYINSKLSLSLIACTLLFLIFGHNVSKNLKLRVIASFAINTLHVGAQLWYFKPVQRRNIPHTPIILAGNHPVSHIQSPTQRKCFLNCVERPMRLPWSCRTLIYSRGGLAKGKEADSTISESGINDPNDETSSVLIPQEVLRWTA